MTGTRQIEAMLVDTNHVLVAASEHDRPRFDFFGSVVTADDLAAGRSSVARKMVYLAGDLSRLRKLSLDGASRVLAIEELSRGHEDAGFEAVGLGSVPLRAAGLGAAENRSTDFIDYGDKFLFSMNEGDYQAPECKRD